MLKEFNKKGSNSENFFYVCSNASCNKDSDAPKVKESAYERGQKKCPKCQAGLIQDKKGVLNKDVKDGCIKIIEDLKSDLSTLSTYRIPPSFFGPAAQKAAQCYHDGKFEQFDSDRMNYNVNIKPQNKNSISFERTKKYQNEMPEIFDFYIKQGYTNKYIGKRERDQAKVDRQKSQLDNHQNKQQKIAE